VAHPQAADRPAARRGGLAWDFRDQILDSMDLERERGITIKANTVSLPYTATSPTRCGARR